jgi:hypothetical protein
MGDDEKAKEMAEGAQNAVKTVAQAEDPATAREAVRDALGDMMVVLPLVWMLVIMGVTQTLKPLVELLIDIVTGKGDDDTEGEKERRQSYYDAAIKLIPMIVGCVSGPYFAVECAALLGLKWGAFEGAFYGGPIGALCTQGAYTLIKDLKLAKLVKDILWARGSAVAGKELQSTHKASPEEMAELRKTLSEQDDNKS